jgi:hypothetical protein
MGQLCAQGFSKVVTSVIASGFLAKQSLAHGYVGIATAKLTALQ